MSLLAFDYLRDILKRYLASQNIIGSQHLYHNNQILVERRRITISISFVIDISLLLW